MVYTWLTSSPAEANASTSVQTRASMKRTGGPGGVPHECGNRVAGFVSGHGFSRAATHRRPKALATEALLNPPGLKPGPFSRSPGTAEARSEEHTSELQSLRHLVCRLLLEKNTRSAPRPASIANFSHSTARGGR